MITLACVACRLALRTTGHYEEVDFLVGMHSQWYPDRYPCPRSGCTARMTLTDVLDGRLLQQLEVHDLTPQECFQALNGMGLPAEKECSVENVEAALRGTVAQLELAPLPGTTRCILRSLIMESGARIYFASSPMGAVVYRIAQPSVHEVLDGHS